MKRTLTYRAVALSLAVVFGVFNVGIPLVIASCPMAKYSSSPTCLECLDDSGPSGQQLTNERNTTCCLTVFAADRNANAFVQARGVVHDNDESFAIQSYSVVTPSLLNIAVEVNPTISPSPPPRGDIPVFNSSLLI